MKLIDLIKDLPYAILSGDSDTDINRIVYDSREVKAGDVFVCISGTKVDANSFLPQVMKNGAKAVVTEKKPEIPLPGITVVLVKSARSALAYMSIAYFDFPTDKMITIGVTGTKGKTTTTHMIKSMLETAGHKVGLVGTNGISYGDVHIPTQNTTPESYELQSIFHDMTKAGCQYMVMEVSSQGLMMHRVDGISFDYGIFTNITPDHIGPGEHASFDEYLHYKGQLFQLCKRGIVNADDPHLDQLLCNHTCGLITFGTEKPADYRAKNISFYAKGKEMGVAFDIEGKANFPARVNVPGMFSLYNSLAALSLCLELGIAKEHLLQALNHVAVEGRMELVYASDHFSVIVDYAHNTVSMESLLVTLRAYNPKRLVCIFGCGGDRARERRFGMGEMGGKLADLCIITADNSRTEKVENIIADIEVGLKKSSGQYIVIPDRREAIHYSIKNAQDGDMIVIIGKGHEDYQEIDGIRYPFLDKAVALEVL